MDNLESLDSSNLNQLASKYSPFLFEIRKKLFIILVVFIAGSLIGFVFYNQIIKFLVDFLSLKGVNIVFTSPFQFINLAINCGIATGLTFVFPILIYQTLSFLKPALSKKEYQLIVKFLPFSLILFICGFIFGVLIMKWQIQIFLDKSVDLGIGNILDISHLLSTVIITSILMGLAFQFPVLLLLLSLVGIVKHKQLAKQRLWVYLGSFIFAILLPPDSIIADVLLSLPLIILFELALLLIRTFEKSAEPQPA